MKVLLLGAGAVGVYFCGRLAQTGAEVSAVAHSGFELIASEGYRIESADGGFRFRPERLLRSAGEYGDEPDWVIVATKALPEIDLPALLRGAPISGKTAILLIQNGIDTERPLLAAFRDCEIYSGVAYIGAARTAPNTVRHHGGSRLLFGRCDGGSCSEKAVRLARTWRSRCVDADATDDIRRLRWKKLLWNTPFNSVSVLGGGLNTREMLDCRDVRTLCVDLMREVSSVAAADGTPLTEREIDETLEYTRDFPPYRTSMLQDFEAGRPLEVDAIVGNVVRLASARGVAVPKLQAVHALLGALDRRVRGGGAARRRPA